MEEPCSHSYCPPQCGARKPGIPFLPLGGRATTADRLGLRCRTGCLAPKVSGKSSSLDWRRYCPLSLGREEERYKMDHLEKFKQIKQSLEQMATEVVCLSEQIQRIREQLESIAPPRVDGE